MNRGSSKKKSVREAKSKYEKSKKPEVMVRWASKMKQIYLSLILKGADRAHTTGDEFQGFRPTTKNAQEPNMFRSEA